MQILFCVKFYDARAPCMEGIRWPCQILDERKLELESWSWDCQILEAGKLEVRQKICIFGEFMI